VLSAVFVMAVVGYRFLGNYSWLEATWLVVITISTVGFSESSTLDPVLQVLTMFVILVGMSAAAYTFGGLIQLMLEGELERIIGRRRMTAEIARLKDHIIICGYGRMGQSLAAELLAEHRECVIIERDAEKLRDVDDSQLTVLTGDATEERVLAMVGIERARTLVSTLPSDADNVFITLTARNLNPQIEIVARAEQQSTEKKLRQAGADRVVLPTIVGSRQMARMITSPTSADLIDLVTQRGFIDLQLDELQISIGSRLIGLSVSETEARRHHNLLVVAIKRADGSLLFNPGGEQRLVLHDVIILMGHQLEIEAFRKKFGATHEKTPQK
jgi:voltage-gated potassium channel